jgi:serine/threonine protein kinase
MHADEDDEQQFKLRERVSESGSSSNKRLMAHSLVGTPNYIAPEILSRRGYTKLCDWWSVGVIFFEMIIGYPPFRDDTPHGTQSKVINWQHTLHVPLDSGLSSSATDLIYRLCTDESTRIGADGIKAHPFFVGFDFGPQLRRSKAPYTPTIKHAYDTSNFEPIDHALVAKRRARLNEINKQQHEHQQQQQKQHQQLACNTPTRQFAVNTENDENIDRTTMLNHPRSAKST